MTEAARNHRAIVVDEDGRAASRVEVQKVGIAVGDALLEQLRLDPIFGENQPDEIVNAGRADGG